MKKLKMLLSICLIVTLALPIRILAAEEATGNPPINVGEEGVGLPSTATDSAERTVAPPIMVENGEEIAVPPVTADPMANVSSATTDPATIDPASTAPSVSEQLPFSAVTNYGGNYMSVIDIASCTFYTDTVVLQPHTIYAVHTYVWNYGAGDNTAFMRYEYPQVTSATGSDSLTLSLSANQQSTEEQITLISSEELQIVPITGYTQWNGAPLTQRAREEYGGVSIGKDNTFIVQWMKPGEVLEVVYFFQTVAKGEAAIALPNAGKGSKAGGEISDPAVPMLCPTNAEPAVRYSIGKSMSSLPKIAPRAEWQVRSIGEPPLQDKPMTATGQ